MKRPTSSKSAPSGPSAATATGGGSIRDRNTRGPAARDTSRRAAATAGEENDEGGGRGAAGVDTAADPLAQAQQDQENYDPKAKQGTPTEFVVVDGGTIDDGKGGKFKVCKAGDVVSLTPERAAHFQKHGVPLVEKKEHDKQQKAREAVE